MRSFFKYKMFSFDSRKYTTFQMLNLHRYIKLQLNYLLAHLQLRFIKQENGDNYK